MRNDSTATTTPEGVWSCSFEFDPKVAWPEHHEVISYLGQTHQKYLFQMPLEGSDAAIVQIKVQDEEAGEDQWFFLTTNKFGGIAVGKETNERILMKFSVYVWEATLGKGVPLRLDSRTKLMQIPGPFDYPVVLTQIPPNALASSDALDEFIQEEFLHRFQERVGMKIWQIVEREKREYCKVARIAVLIYFAVFFFTISVWYYYPGSRWTHAYTFLLMITIVVVFRE